MLSMWKKTVISLQDLFKHMPFPDTLTSVMDIFWKMLVTMANSLMYSIGKSLIRPTWPGGQVTQSTSQTKPSFGTCGIGITETNSKMILLTKTMRTKIN